METKISSLVAREEIVTSREYEIFRNSKFLENFYLENYLVTAL